MDTLYSLTLGAAMVAAAVSFLLGIGGLRKTAADPSRGKTLLRLAARGAILAGGLLILSVTVHLGFGHRPATEQALGFAPFVREHPAFAIVAVIPLALFLSFHRLSRG